MPGIVNKTTVNEFKKDLKRASSFALAEFDKVSVKDFEEFRRNLQAKGSWCKVMKNRLLRIAFKENGLESPDEFFQGSTLAVMSEGEVTDYAKVLADLSKKIEEVKIKGGFIEGKAVSGDEIMAISKLPSREVLIAKILGSMNAPVTNFVCVLSAVLKSLLYVLKAVGEKKAQSEVVKGEGVTGESGEETKTAQDENVSPESKEKELVKEKEPASEKAEASTDNAKTGELSGDKPSDADKNESKKPNEDK